MYHPNRWSFVYATGGRKVAFKVAPSIAKDKIGATALLEVASLFQPLFTHSSLVGPLSQVPRNERVLWMLWIYETDPCE